MEDTQVRETQVMVGATPDGAADNGGYRIPRLWQGHRGERCEDGKPVRGSLLKLTPE